MHGDRPALVRDHAPTDRRTDGTTPTCADASDATLERALRCSVTRGSAVVVLEGQGVTPATLREAADAVHVPSEDELEQLFSDVRVEQGGPPERGDLPPGGDGAPVDPSGPGG